VDAEGVERRTAHQRVGRGSGRLAAAADARDDATDEQRRSDRFRRDMNRMERVIEPGNFIAREFERSEHDEQPRGTVASEIRERARRMQVPEMRRKRG